jgi:hypothetical protein
MMNYKTSFSTRLRVKLQLACGPEESNIDLKLKEKAQAWFRNYIVTTHSIIRSSVPLMEAAHERSKTTNLTEEGKLMAELRNYYKKHSQEEMNHDEWLLDDLESIGVSRQESLSRKPSQAVAELVGSQYHWIFHWHPICLLGYISYLEGNPPKMELISQLKRITEYPETAFRTLVKHCDLDPHHRDDLNELLEALPLTAEHEQWITFNALYSAKKLREIRTL